MGIEMSGGQTRRITTLDGLRGLATIMVIVSHYFGELPHGLRIATVGWIAVNMFFVLSGFLIGKLILERRHHANFFTVFYVRRFCRILPAYILTIVVLTILIDVLPRWTDSDIRFPLWSYLTFSQGFVMTKYGSIGAHWLSPTWTLSVEEYFYLLAPATIVFTPRKWLVPVLLAAAAVSVGIRTEIFFFSPQDSFFAFATLPGQADTIVCGMLAAIAYRSDAISWNRLIPALRLTPVIGLGLVALLHWTSEPLFNVLKPLLLGIASAAYILCIVLGTPEARRFESKTLQFFGNNGYCLYLTHLAVLGLVHGLLLGSKPDLATPSQWMATLLALPICVLVGWGMTKLIEEPLTRYGRNWRWKDARAPRGEAVAAPELRLPTTQAVSVRAPARHAKPDSVGAILRFHTESHEDFARSATENNLCQHRSVRDDGGNVAVNAASASHAQRVV